MENKIFITKSFEETQKVGENFARSDLANLSTILRGPTLQKQGIVIALYGDLGSGKTTFVQGMAKGLDIQRRLISPTFNIVRRYEVKIQNSPFRQSFEDRARGKISSKKSKAFYHIDLYRLEDQKEIENLGLKEILSDPQNIVAIEWAERLGSLLPKVRIDIRFEHLEGDERKIIIRSNIKQQRLNPK